MTAQPNKDIAPIFLFNLAIPLKNSVVCGEDQQVILFVASGFLQNVSLTVFVDHQSEERTDRQREETVHRADSRRGHLGPGGAEARIAAQTSG